MKSNHMPNMTHGKKIKRKYCSIRYDFIFIINNILGQIQLAPISHRQQAVSISIIIICIGDNLVKNDSFIYIYIYKEKPRK